MNNIQNENQPYRASFAIDAVHSPTQEGGSTRTFPFLSIFNTQSSASLLLSPQFVIEAATDALLKETFKTREEITGKYLFDAFPDIPDAPQSLVTANLRASLQQVLATGKPHQMPPQQYDIADPDKPGQFLARYWSTVNTPVFDEKGQIAYILHETINVSETMQAKHKLHESLAREKQAVDRGEQQRSRLERLFEQAPAALAVLSGPDLVFSDLNKTCQEMFPERKLAGLPLLEALPELKDHPVAEAIQHVFKTGETLEGKEELIPMARSKGKPVENRYWNFICQAIYTTAGQVDGVLAFSLDVTEMVQARQEVESKSESLLYLNRQLENRVAERTKELQKVEADAKRQRKRLEDLFMQAPAAICILEGPELVYTLVNPVYEQLFPGRKLLGKPILEALPEIEHNPVYQSFQQVYASGITHKELELLIPFERPDGGALEDRYFRYIQQARYNEQKQVDGVVVFALEVTEQVKARIAVEESEHELKLITNALPVLIGYMDRELKYCFTNKAYESWFPVKSEDLIGKPVWDVIGEAAFKNIKAYMEQALAGESVGFEACMPYRDNFIKHIQASYIPDQRGGVVHGFYTLVTDVTQQVDARKALEESEQKATMIADKLAITNQELHLANSELEKYNRDLEERVKMRTAALQKTNELLKKNIKERKATGESLAKSHQQLQALTRHLQVMREEERKFIARELHDELGQAFTALKIDVILLLKSIGEGKVEQAFLEEELSSMMKTINASIAAVREIVATLRPAVLEDFGLLSELESQVQDFQKRNAIQMDIQTDLEYITLDTEVSIEVFRIMQESMTNIARHSGASKAVIRIDKTKQHFCFTIEDDGIGLQQDSLLTTRTFGLRGMQERAEQIGAKLTFVSQPGKGMRVVLEVPST